MVTNSMQSTNNNKKKVLLLDSEELVRKGIKTIINSFEGFTVSSEASSAEEALDILKHHELDIIVLEIALPNRSGIDFLHELVRRKKPFRAVCLSHVDSAEMVVQAMLSGAQSYLLKSGSIDELEEGLKISTESNNRYLPPRIAHLGDIPVNRYELEGTNPIDPLSPLSPREREIFHLLANGLQNTTIAKKLFISPRTVETHRARVVRKLGLGSNGELIRFAIKHGLSIP